MIALCGALIYGFGAGYTYAAARREIDVSWSLAFTLVWPMVMVAFLWYERQERKREHDDDPYSV